MADAAAGRDFNAEYQDILDGLQKHAEWMVTSGQFRGTVQEYLTNLARIDIKAQHVLEMMGLENLND